MISNEKTYHYCWIENISRLLSKQTSVEMVLDFIVNDVWIHSGIKEDRSLEKHLEYCKNHDAIKITLPEKSTMLKFKNYNHSMRVPFVINGGFEFSFRKIFEL